MKLKQTTFLCFSPPVMIATFAIELLMLVYVLWRYKLSNLTKLATLILGSLAVFQIAEYNVCGGMGLHAATWSRVGYIAIALLPPLGFHIYNTIVGKQMDRWQGLAYGTAAVWIAAFAFSGRAFQGYVCGGNYVIFQLKSPLGGVFFIWYYILLLATITLAYRSLKSSKPKVQSALQSLIVGYALFMVPTSVINLFSPATLSGVPSIMCGFAILFAITIVGGIMPLEKERKVQAAFSKTPRR